jgi:serine/threonine-protein kinase
MGDADAGSRAGTVFGQYRLLRLLGRGGFGEVYEAHDTVMDRVVALKLLNEVYSRDQVFRARLQREARAAGRLHDPHVVSIHGLGEADGLLYVDMRLVEGTDLGSVLKASGPMAPARAVAIVGQVASALDAAHAGGVIHRDVKPANVLLTDSDFAYLVDFGIANAATEETLTQVGDVLGTCAYMAPERFTGDPDTITDSVDVYALACLLHELLTGSPPYQGDRVGLMGAHLTRPVPRPSALYGGIPVAFDEVIACGMAKNRDDRYPSAGALARAAQYALTSTQQDQLETIIARTQLATRAAAPSGPETAPTMWAGKDAPSAALTARPATRDDAVSAPIASAGAPSPADTAAPLAGSGVQPPAGNITDSDRSPTVTGAPPTPSTLTDATTGDAKSAELPPWQRLSRRTRWIITGAAAVVVLIVAALIPLGHQSPSPGGIASPTSTTSRPASAQVELPFTGLNGPFGVAVDSGGAVYLADSRNNRVLKLPPGSTEQTTLPFTGLDTPWDVAVDGAGAVYVAEQRNDPVLKLAAGSSTQTTVPFKDFLVPYALAVDGAGTLYVAAGDRVLKVPPGSTTETTLPFIGLYEVLGVAVDGAGAVYAADAKANVVLKLEAGATTQTTLPFTGLNVPCGVAVDGAGGVYVADSGNARVLKLAAGSTTQTTLPFTGLGHVSTPYSFGYLAVDGVGNVYVSDTYNNRVLKLPAQ